MDKPWDDEVDFLSGEFCNLKYEVKRNLDTGSLCGYIIIPPGNPLNQLEGYDDDRLGGIRVHGGWTYCDNEGDNIVIGFDCAHLGDLVPMMALIRDQLPRAALDDTETYRTIEYVEDQCKRACWQIAGNTFIGPLNEALYERYSSGE